MIKRPSLPDEPAGSITDREETKVIEQDEGHDATERMSRDAIASELFAILGTGRQITSIAQRSSAFDLAEAYSVAQIVREKREARGERPIGRKIGFTNRTIWDEYDVHHPIWGSVYDRTVHELAPGLRFSLAGLAEPRIEPEIIFGLAHPPSPGMDLRDLLGCVAWVAHGFEIVQSVFEGWRFTPAETVAAYGLHGALFIGPRHPIGLRSQAWLDALASFRIRLYREGEEVDRGEARNVLDGPLHALAHLVEVLAADPLAPPLEPGEIVTTGTLTRAFPISGGETWSTALSGIALEPASIGFAP